jgi:hypothetical protein
MIKNQTEIEIHFPRGWPVIQCQDWLLGRWTSNFFLGATRGTRWQFRSFGWVITFKG